MSESQYIASNSYRRAYKYKLGPYENYIRDELSAHPYLSSSQVHDHLKEHFPGFPSVNVKTVYNYALHVRQKYTYPKNLNKDNALMKSNQKNLLENMPRENFENVI